MKKTLSVLGCWLVLGTSAIPAEVITQEKTYEHIESAVPSGKTINGTLESDEFPFELTAGKYRVLVQSVAFDDKGSIGGVASSTGSSCGWPNQIPAGTDVTAAVTVNGKRLQVAIQATDNSTCAVEVGWRNTRITWMAWAGTENDPCKKGSETTGVTQKSASQGDDGINITTKQDPVNLGAGSTFFSDYEYVPAPLPGQVLNAGLAFGRYQSSGNKDLAPLHGGWTHNYNVQLTTNTGSVLIHDWLGSPQLFILTNGAYAGDGSGTLSKPDGTNFLWQLPHGTRFTFAADDANRLATIADRLGNTVTLSYSTAGQLSTVYDSAGRYLTLFSNASNQLTSVVDPLGRTNSFTYESGGRLAQVTDPLGGRAQYIYGNSLHSNAITQLINARGFTNSFTYGPDGRALSETNALGKIQSYHWGTNQVTVTNFAAASFTIFNNPTGSVTARVDAAGTTTFWRDAEGRLTNTVDRLGGATQYLWDTNSCACSMSGNLLRLIDPLGRTNSWTYEPAFNYPLTHTNPAGDVTLWNYDAKGNVTTNTDPAGATTRFSYDPLGNLTAVTDHYNRTTAMGYDSFGNRTNLTDALGNRTGFGYDLIGRRTSRTDALGRTDSFAYDVRDQLTRHINAAGETNRWSYDGNGNIIAWTNALDRGTSYSYDPLDRLQSVTLPGDGTPFLRYGYDDGNNRTNVTDALGNTTRFGYDRLGRLTAITNALNKAWGFQVDAEGRRVRTTDPKNRVNGFVYDGAGQLIRWTNALNQVTAFAYDKLGNLGTLTDARNQTMSFGYDPASRLTSITHAGISTESFAYDLVGNLTGLVNRAGQSIALTYDDANRLTQKSYLGGIDQISFRYDNANQLTGICWQVGVATNSLLGFAYDAAGRLTNETQVVGTSPARGIGYEYYADGRRKKLVYPDGTWITYEYNLKGWLTAIKDGGTNTVVSYDYDAAGRRTKRTLENSTFTVYDYDAANQLTNLWHRQTSGGTTNSISRYQYLYDDAGNRTNVNATVGSLSRSEQYTYDAADQLIGVTYKTNGLTERTVTYAFDAGGNRMLMTEDSGLRIQDTTYTANALNQYTSVVPSTNLLTVTGYVEPGARSNKWYASVASTKGLTGNVATNDGTFAIPEVPVSSGANALTVTVTDVSANIATQIVNFTVAHDIGHDGNGNQTNSGVWAMSYDRENRLVSAASATQVIHYTYDALGRLIERRTVGAVAETNRMYYAGWQMIAEYNGAGTLQRKYVYGPGIDEPVRMTVAATPLPLTYYFHADGLGSVTEITSTTGQLVESYRYDVYGTPTILDPQSSILAASAIGNRLLFTARDRDPDTTWYNYRYRYYNPTLGRFVQPDPIGVRDGANLYSYALNNPVRFIDTDGASAREATDFWADIAARNYGTGFWGEAAAFGANTMGMFIHMWNANEIEQHAEKSGHYSAIPGCEGKAVGHGLAVAGYAALDFLKFTGLSKIRGPEFGRWKEAGEWQEGLHIHIDLGKGLAGHHLPQQTGNFLKNLGAVISRWWR